jgi:ankyrin repeat protein
MFMKYSNPEAVKDVFKAVQDEDLDNLRFCLTDGADPDLRNEQGQTLLHKAVMEGKIKAARLLLDAGADADLHGGSPGYTSLHWAAYRQSADMTRLLLEYTTQLERTDHQSMTPLQLAAFMGARGVVEALAEAGADYRRTDVSGHSPAALAQQRAGEDWNAEGRRFIETSTYLYQLMQNGLPEKTADKTAAAPYSADQFAEDMAALEKFKPDTSRFRLGGAHHRKPPKP